MGCSGGPDRALRHTCAGHLVPEGALCAALTLPLDEEGADVGRIPLVVGGGALHLHQ